MAHRYEQNSATGTNRPFLTLKSAAQLGLFDAVAALLTIQDVKDHVHTPTVMAWAAGGGLLDFDENVRILAATLLGSPDKRTIQNDLGQMQPDALSEIYDRIQHDPSPRVRKLLAQALDKRGDTSAIVAAGLHAEATP